MSRKVLAIITLALAGLACNTVMRAFAPKPEIAWDADPDVVIVSATYCCGLAPQLVVENYIPEARVWGDGRMMWVEYDNTGDGRRVLEGQLTTAQMTAALQHASDEGFFGWENTYANYNVTDLSSQCLVISLASGGKSVCEYYEGAPQAFHGLYAYFATGAGIVGTDYVPTTGYLTAYAITPSPNQTPDLRWPAESLGFSLNQATGGKWVDGEALELAWRVVNGNRWSNLVQDGNDYYQLSLKIPNVSQSVPPTPTPQ